ncbi:hypothetical protein [Spiroplasma endosymbiont of Ammophila pubescens]
MHLIPPPPIWYAFLAGGVVIFDLISVGLKAGYQKIYHSWL